MTVCWLATATYEDVAALDRARAVVVLPLGATEAHGPHLPLSTDGIIVEAMAREGARRLAARGLAVAVAPTVALTPVPFAAAFAGSVGVAPATLTATIVEAAAALAAHRFRRLVLVSAHLDPAHLAAVHEARVQVAATGMRVAFPDLTRKPWALRLGDEFKSGACHAGRFETSIILAERPQLVRAVRAELPANPKSISEAIRVGQRSFAEAGGPRAYFGAPAAASAEEGRALVEELGAILEEAALTLTADEGE